MQAFATRRDVDGAEAVFARMKAQGLSPDIVPYSILLNLHANRGDVAKAEETFKEMKEVGNLPRSTRAYTALMKAYMKRKDTEGAEDVLFRMAAAGETPDVHAYTILMRAYGKRGDIQGAEDVMRRVLLAVEGGKEGGREGGGMVLDVVIFNALLRAYVTGKMPIVVGGGRREGGRERGRGLEEGVQSVLARMKEQGLEPDETTEALLATTRGERAKRMKRQQQLLKGMTIINKGRGIGGGRGVLPSSLASEAAAAAAAAEGRGGGRSGRGQVVAGGGDVASEAAAAAASPEEMVRHFTARLQKEKEARQEQQQPLQQQQQQQQLQQEQEEEQQPSVSSSVVLPSSFPPSPPSAAARVTGEGEGGEGGEGGGGSGALSPEALARVHVKSLVAALTAQQRALLPSLLTDEEPYLVVLRACVEAGDDVTARSVLQLMPSPSPGPSLSAFNLLLHLHAKKGETLSAERVLAQIAQNGLSPSLSSYNTLLHAYVRRASRARRVSQGEQKRVEAVYKALRRSSPPSLPSSLASSSLRPDSYTLTAMLRWLQQVSRAAHSGGQEREGGGAFMMEEEEDEGWMLGGMGAKEQENGGTGGGAGEGGGRGGGREGGTAHREMYQIVLKDIETWLPPERRSSQLYTALLGAAAAEEDWERVEEAYEEARRQLKQGKMPSRAYAFVETCYRKIKSTKELKEGGREGGKEGKREGGVVPSRPAVAGARRV